MLWDFYIRWWVKLTKLPFFTLGRLRFVARLSEALVRLMGTIHLVRCTSPRRLLTGRFTYGRRLLLTTLGRTSAGLIISPE